MQELWIEKQINKNITKRIFKYYELGIMGCGRDSTPFLDLTNIIQLPKNKQEIFDELANNLVTSRLYNKVSGIIPKELNQGRHLINYYYNFIENYIDQSTLDRFNTHDEFDQYILRNFDCKSWQNLLAPRISDIWFNKSLDNKSKWLDNHNTPKFKEWVESLRETVFDQLGRIIVFNSRINEPVMIHRDYHYRAHTSHFINFQFSGATNIAFVYDEVTKEKIYVDTPFYMFNECDLHGVDACSEPRFTVRIDGVFKPHICELLDLNNGNVWDENSSSFSKIKNIKIIEPVFE
jgi:hypothetical protein